MTPSFGLALSWSSLIPMDPTTSPQYLIQFNDGTTKSVPASKMASLIPKPQVLTSNSSHLLPLFLFTSLSLPYNHIQHWLIYFPKSWWCSFHQQTLSSWYSNRRTQFKQWHHPLVWHCHGHPSSQWIQQLPHSTSSNSTMALQNQCRHQKWSPSSQNHKFQHPILPASSLCSFAWAQRLHSNTMGNSTRDISPNHPKGHIASATIPISTRNTSIGVFLSLTSRLLGTTRAPKELSCLATLSQLCKGQVSTLYQRGRPPPRVPPFVTHGPCPHKSGSWYVAAQFLGGEGWH